MRVLLVHCHPRSDSFSAALADAAETSLRGAGHAVERRDLYAENFSPAVTAEAHRHYMDFAMNQQGVEADVTQLQRAEALLLVYPTWWYGMPAVLKGWFDRVWVPGVTFVVSAGAIQPRLTNIRRIGVVTTYGSPLWLLLWLGWPDRRVIGGGIRRLCAKGCKLDWLYLTRMNYRTATERQDFVRRVQDVLARW
jgi:putative NADPH-quinone reductase